MNNLGKNDAAWKILFERHNICEHIEKHGLFEISSTQINKEREARLMTKFDNKSHLPNLFEENKLSILPVARGNYIIAPFDAYHDFAFDKPVIQISSEIEYIKFPEHIQSINHYEITSESIAVNCAYVSGILQDFIGDEHLLPTLNGRMSSNKFEFRIDNLLTNTAMPIKVQNSQIEIDAGYEGIETFSIIEAKNNISDDFLIRQLYYPFRRIQDSITKKVKTIFMVYTNNVFYLYEYMFEDPHNYNSLRLNKFKRYSFEKLDISLSDIRELVKNIKFIELPKGIPFPQANSFERVINLCEILLKNNLSANEVADANDFVDRQTGYYYNAGKYLGLFTKIESAISLTPLALQLMKYPARKRTLAFIKLILQVKPFYDALMLYLEKGKPPSSRDVVSSMMQNGLDGIYSEKTIRRRESTVRSWVSWIFDQISNND